MLVWTGPMLIAALFEVASVGIILPVVLALSTPIEHAGEFVLFFQRGLDMLATDRVGQVVSVAVLFALLFLIKNIYLFAVNFFFYRFLYSIQQRLMGALYSAYLVQPLLARMARHSSERHRNLLQATSTIMGNGYMPTFQMALDVAVVTGMLVMLAMVDMPTLLLVVGVGTGGSLLFTTLMAPHLQRWGRKVLTMEGEVLRLNTHTQSLLPEIHVRQCEDFFRRRFESLLLPLTRYRMLVQIGSFAPRIYLEAVGVAVLAATVVTVFLSSSTDAEAAARLTVFLAAVVRLLPCAQRLVSQVSTIRSGIAASEELERDFAEAKQHMKRDNGQEQPISDTWREIRVRDLCFRFTDDTDAALDNVSFTLQRGDSLGIVGPSGSGKSTLLRVMLGLLPPRSGTITVDEMDIFHSLGSWRRRIGFVPQEAELLDDSLRANVAMGEEPEAIDDTRVWAALRRAHLEELARSFPDGLDTRMGERGARLSGGQRQRVGIARALYHEPDILMFDEATSALDGETERDITSAIDALKGNMTVVVIAHRLTTVQHCSRILFLRQGRVARCAGYQELLRDFPDFRQFAAAHAPGS